MSGTDSPDTRRLARRVKIVCTLGPATTSRESIDALFEAGIDVARLNLSHGTHDEHRTRIERVRAACEATGRVVSILADLQGPRIRLGTFAGGGVELEAGAEFTLDTERIQGDARRATVAYEALARDVRPGDTILIDDGRVRLSVLATDGRAVTTRVVEGGRVADHKGLNLPGVSVSAPALTEKDAFDLRFAIASGVDYVALSFVRSPDDAELVRRAMDAAGGRLPVIAKIERAEAVERLEEVVAAFDGIMVARGDLGVELPLERVPLVQKHAIALARAHAKPVIVATQMLEGMVHASRPTRAEVSDVANAVFDGADALMLSAETGIGERPADATATMARIIAAAEESVAAPVPPAHEPRRAEEALAAAAARVANDLGAVAIAAFTTSGGTARWIARQRPPRRLLAFTSDPAVRTRLALLWGVEPLLVPESRDTDAMVRQVERVAVANGIAAPGELVVIVAGVPPGTPGSTNMVRVHRVVG